jgi:hypothetical protein
MTENRIPRKSEMVQVSTKSGSTNVRPNIARALDDDSVIAKMEVYKTNGGKCGNNRMDDTRAMDITVAADSELFGGTIKRLLDTDAITENEVLRQFNVELRVRYVLDKNGKIVGVNPKHFRLLGN